MGKKYTPSFVVERRMYLEPFQYDFLQNKMNACNKMYNTAIRHYKNTLERLYADEEYQSAYEKFICDDEKIHNIGFCEICTCIKNYKLGKYDIHSFMGKQKCSAFNKCIGINVAQKLGDSVYASIKKAVFSKTDVHFRKFGQTDSFEDKKANNGIIFNAKHDNAKVFGVVIALKPVRKNDTYMQNALTKRVKYCRVVRKPFKNKYHCFLQIVLEGTPPEKVKLGHGYCGIDEGVSTVAYYNDTKSDFVVLADGVEKYEKRINVAAIKCERRLKMANIDNYNPNGTVKKGAKRWIRTKGYRRALMELKNAYRLKSEFIKQTHNRLINQMVQHFDIIIKEPMDFKALAKKTKTTKRSDKPSIVIQKNGKGKVIYKYTKRKRFGKSVGRRAPGLFNKKLCDKVLRLNGMVVDVNIQEYKASQYNHITHMTEKQDLSKRTKLIDGNIVQRDLYSSFLLYNILDEAHIDFNKCNFLFNDFLIKQNAVVEKVRSLGDKTKNFGLKDFVLSI